MIESDLEFYKWLMQRAIYDILLRPWFNTGYFQGGKRQNILKKKKKKKEWDAWKTTTLHLTLLSARRILRKETASKHVGGFIGGRNSPCKTNCEIQNSKFSKTIIKLH